MAGLKSVELWGGAATISIPEHMVDASDIRPVPDNQEVYLDSSSGQAVVVEIVEPVTPPASTPPAAFCFKDLADISGATVKHVHTQRLGLQDMPLLTGVDFIETASGVHELPYREQHPQPPVHVMLVLIRLCDTNGDIMLTFSTPEKAATGEVAPVPDAETEKDAADKAARQFQAISQTLHIRDRSLLS